MPAHAEHTVGDFSLSALCSHVEGVPVRARVVPEPPPLPSLEDPTPGRAPWQTALLWPCPRPCPCSHSAQSGSTRGGGGGEGQAGPKRQPVGDATVQLPQLGRAARCSSWLWVQRAVAAAAIAGTLAAPGPLTWGAEVLGRPPALCMRKSVYDPELLPGVWGQHLSVLSWLHSSKPAVPLLMPLSFSDGKHN